MKKEGKKFPSVLFPLFFPKRYGEKRSLNSREIRRLYSRTQVALLLETGGSYTVQ